MIILDSSSLECGRQIWGGEGLLTDGNITVFAKVELLRNCFRQIAFITKILWTEHFMATFISDHSSCLYVLLNGNNGAEQYSPLMGLWTEDGSHFIRARGGEGTIWIIRYLNSPNLFLITRLRKVGTTWTPYSTMQWFSLRRAEDRHQTYKVIIILY